jgi:hypothetical protein
MAWLWTVQKRMAACYPAHPVWRQVPGDAGGAHGVGLEHSDMAFGLFFLFTFYSEYSQMIVFE